MIIYQYYSKPQELNGYKEFFTDPWRCYEYALALGHPVPELEDIIASDSEASLWYAMQVLRGPFKLGESEIAKDWVDSLDYATKVLKRRFQLGEKVMRRNAQVWREYCDHFGLDSKLS